MCARLVVKYKCSRRAGSTVIISSAPSRERIEDLEQVWIFDQIGSQLCSVVSHKIGSQHLVTVFCCECDWVLRVLLLKFFCGHPILVMVSYLVTHDVTHNNECYKLKFFYGQTLWNYIVALCILYCICIIYCVAYCILYHCVINMLCILCTKAAVEIKIQPEFANLSLDNPAASTISKIANVSLQFLQLFYIKQKPKTSTMPGLLWYCITNLQI